MCLVHAHLQDRTFTQTTGRTGHEKKEKQRKTKEQKNWTHLLPAYTDRFGQTAFRDIPFCIWHGSCTALSVKTLQACSACNLHLSPNHAVCLLSITALPTSSFFHVMANHTSCSDRTSISASFIAMSLSSLSSLLTIFVSMPTSSPYSLVSLFPCLPSTFPPKHLQHSLFRHL